MRFDFLFLQARQYSDRLGISFEAAVPLHYLVKRSFAVVAEGGMPQVMRQRGEMNQVDVDRGVLELFFPTVEVQRDASRDLRDFEAVCQPVSKEVVFIGGKELCLSLEPPKAWRMN